MFDNFLQQFGSALLGGGAMAAFVVWYIKSAITAAETKQRADLEMRRNRFKAENKWRHSLGRVVFWIVHGITDYERENHVTFWNGDLKAAFDEMNAAETAIKDIDAEQLANVNENK